MANRTLTFHGQCSVCKMMSAADQVASNTAKRRQQRRLLETRKVDGDTATPQHGSRLATQDAHPGDLGSSKHSLLSAPSKKLVSPPSLSFPSHSVDAKDRAVDAAVEKQPTLSYVYERPPGLWECSFTPHKAGKTPQHILFVCPLEYGYGRERFQMDQEIPDAELATIPLNWCRIELNQDAQPQGVQRLHTAYMKFNCADYLHINPVEINDKKYPYVACCMWEWASYFMIFFGDETQLFPDDSCCILADAGQVCRIHQGGRLPQDARTIGERWADARAASRHRLCFLVELVRLSSVNRKPALKYSTAVELQS